MALFTRRRRRDYDFSMADGRFRALYMSIYRAAPRQATLAAMRGPCVRQVIRVIAMRRWSFADAMPRGEAHDARRAASSFRAATAQESQRLCQRC